MKRITRHINPAMVLALVALVFAVTGGAYAASGSGGNDGHATASVAKKKPKKKSSSTGKPGPRGPAGLAGAAGAQGPAGPTGPAGAAGVKGENGTNGADGTNGTDGVDGKDGTNGTSAEGVSFTGAKAVGSVTCEEGGVEVKSAKPATAVCNGKTGFTKTLPPGNTETGTWAETQMGIPKEGTEELQVAFPFAIPLSATGEAVFLNQAETENEAGTEGCTGTVAKPTAPAGFLCVYTAEETNTNIGASPFFAFNGELGYQTSGAVLRFHVEAAPAHIQMNGSWAVTAPTS